MTFHKKHVIKYYTPYGLNNLKKTSSCLNKFKQLLQRSIVIIFFSFLAVEEMRRGSSPTVAAQTAISRITKKYPNFMGAVLVCRLDGQYGAACNGMDNFPFSVANEKSGGAILNWVPCNYK